MFAGWVLIARKGGVSAPEPWPAFCDRSPRSIYRWALIRGWSIGEAANLAAWCWGIPLSFELSPLKPWTLATVQDMLFLRSMRARWPG